MRRSVALVACAASLAVAGPEKAEKKLKPIDVKPVIDKLLVFRDDVGSYYIVPSPNSFSNMDDGGTWVFFGDAKALYQQRIIGSSVENDGQNLSWILWAPRARGINSASLELATGKLTLTCNTKGKRALTPLKADETKTLFTKATLYPPLWQRQAHLLARDDDGVYYFVDELREEYGGNGYRVFVGMKGAMKEVAMTNVVSDSGGEIFATKSGQLKIISTSAKGSDAGKTFWMKGGKKLELTMLEPVDNRYLIYRELGIYGSIGAVCDDQ
jgi:hypothetical protein